MKVKDLVAELLKLDQEMPVMQKVDTRGNRDDWGVYYTPFVKTLVSPAWPRNDMRSTLGPYDNGDFPIQILVF